jgi:cytochrome c biogenesis protein CcdA
VKTVIGEILPLALVVTVSPINIIAGILLLFSKRPLTNAAAYLVGFTVGVAGLLAALIAIAGALDLHGHSNRASGGGGLVLVLGVVLLVMGFRRFRKRPRHGETSPRPKWMAGIEDFSPGKSLGTGVVVGVANPKNLVVAVAAAVTVATAGLSAGQQVVVGVVYVVVAILGVAAPLVVAVSLGQRSHDVLESWKTWLDQNNATVMALLFVIFGVVLIGKGIGGV